MATFLKACCSSNPRGEPHALDSEEYIKNGKKLMNWKIPKVPTSKIYKTNPFTFFSDPSIITKETNIYCGNGSHGFNLLSQNPFMDGFSTKKIKFYSMLNMGMIQIGVKTMTRKIPSNASIILCVSDDRIIHNFEDSILGLVESKLSEGPMYFNVFPNITMSLFHPKLLETFSLLVIVKGFEQLPKGAKPISLMFRSCYKLEDNVLPDALLESPQGKTVFFQTGFENSNVAVQKVSKWEDVRGKLVELISLENKKEENITGV